MFLYDEEYDIMTIRRTLLAILAAILALSITGCSGNTNKPVVQETIVTETTMAEETIAPVPNTKTVNMKSMGISFEIPVEWEERDNEGEENAFKIKHYGDGLVAGAIYTDEVPDAENSAELHQEAFDDMCSMMAASLSSAMTVTEEKITLEVDGKRKTDVRYTFVVDGRNQDIKFHMVEFMGKRQYVMFFVNEYPELNDKNINAVYDMIDSMQCEDIEVESEESVVIDGYNTSVTIPKSWYIGQKENYNMQIFSNICDSAISIISYSDSEVPEEYTRYSVYELHTSQILETHENVKFIGNEAKAETNGKKITKRRCESEFMGTPVKTCFYLVEYDGKDEFIYVVVTIIGDGNETVEKEAESIIYSMQYLEKTF